MVSVVQQRPWWVSSGEEDVFRYDPAWKKKVLGLENGAVPGEGCPRDPDQDLLKVLGQGLVYTGR